MKERRSNGTTEQRIRRAKEQKSIGAETQMHGGAKMLMGAGGG
jgi:hypothetical protein